MTTSVETSSAVANAAGMNAKCKVEYANSSEGLRNDRVPAAVLVRDRAILLEFTVVRSPFADRRVRVQVMEKLPAHKVWEIPPTQDTVVRLASAGSAQKTAAKAAATKQANEMNEGSH